MESITSGILSNAGPGTQSFVDSAAARWILELQHQQIGVKLLAIIGFAPLLLAIIGNCWLLLQLLAIIGNYSFAKSFPIIGFYCNKLKH